MAKHGTGGPLETSTCRNCDATINFKTVGGFGKVPSTCPGCGTRVRGHRRITISVGDLSPDFTNGHSLPAGATVVICRRCATLCLDCWTDEDILWLANEWDQRVMGSIK